jgi:hypothetical protein
LVYVPDDFLLRVPRDLYQESENRARPKKVQDPLEIQIPDSSDEKDVWLARHVRLDCKFDSVKCTV